MSVTSAKGFEAAGVAAGLKSGPYKDVALVLNTGPLDVAAAVFTQNRIFAAPVAWSRGAIADHKAQAVILNSGGANACTGPEGFADCVSEVEHLQVLLDQVKGRNLRKTDILVCSTGLIGQRLPLPKLISGISNAVVHLGSSEDDGKDAAHAIMTTDSVPKMTNQPREGWTVGGMAKGAGMLAPELATMLVVLTTDAVVDANLADEALRNATSLTLDRLDSDGCMSTNDTVILMASGASGVTPSDGEFKEAVAAACADIAQQLMADAEGASHDITITVKSASSVEAALAVARAVSRSNLVKTAIFGNDPNWGRILSAAGTVPESVAPFDPNEVAVTINDVEVCRRGAVGADRNLVDLGADRSVRIVIDLAAGNATASLLTNDLTHDYVHENSAYSS